jgi:hypothetical protein
MYYARPTKLIGSLATDTRAFSATERFINKTKNVTASITTAKSQKQSKYASADACWWRRFSSACHASCCAAAGPPVCRRKRA